MGKAGNRMGAGGYKFIKFVYCKLSANHIPYFVCSYIQGPKGGMYVLDEFNTEYLFRKITGVQLSGKESIVKNLVSKNGVVARHSEYDAAENKKVAKEFGYRYLERLNGKDTTEKIAKGLDEQQRKTILETKVY